MTGRTKPPEGYTVWDFYEGEGAPGVPSHEAWLWGVDHPDEDEEPDPETKAQATAQCWVHADRQRSIGVQLVLSQVLGLIQLAREAGETDLRQLRAWVEDLLPATTPTEEPPADLDGECITCGNEYAVAKPTTNPYDCDMCETRATLFVAAEVERQRTPTEGGTDG